MNKQAHLLTWLMTAALASVNAWGQSAPTQSQTEDQIVELSPFTISASEEGYRPKHTLVGSRLRVSMDDITVPVDIITPEVIEDFGVTATDDLYNIVSNMEEGDNLFVDAVYSSGSNYKIRGFYGITTLRNFISGWMPFDSYNASRFVASKGPNAILYGAGPAGGSVSFFTNQYQFGGKDRGRLSVALDNWGTVRGEFSLNKGIIKDVLGINVAFMRENRKYEIKPDYKGTTALYLSGRFRPFPGTTISVTYEKRNEDAFYGTSNFTQVTDRHSDWEYSGHVAILGAPDADGSYFGKGKVVDIMLPTGTVLTGQNPKDWGAYTSGNTQRMTLMDGRLINTAGWIFSDLRDGLGTETSKRSFKSKDWPRKYNPAGHNGGAKNDYEAYDVTLEQKITDDFYVMFVVGSNDVYRRQYQNRIRDLHVDPTYYLPTGEPNPNFGKYFVEMQPTGTFLRDYDNTTVAGTAAYELDLRNINEALGVHNIAYMYQNFTSKVSAVRESFKLTKAPEGVRTIYDVDNYNRKGDLDLTIREYLDFDNGKYYMSDYRGWTDAGIVEIGDYAWELLGGIGGGVKDRTVTESNMVVLQSTWWNRRLITSLGYRTERVDFYSTYFAANYSKYDSEGKIIPGSGMNGRFTAYEPYTIEQDLDPNFEKVLTDEVLPDEFPDVKYNTFTGTSKNMGAIFRITPSIAVLGNTAQNVNPVYTRTGIFGRRLPTQIGTSTDIGLRWSFFKDRLRLEYTRFETKDEDAALQSSALRTPFGQANILISMMQENGITIDNPLDTDFAWDTYDQTSRGHEISLSGDPIPNFSLRVAVSKTDMVREDLGGEFMPWWYEMAPRFEAFATDPATKDYRLSSNTDPDSNLTAEYYWESALDTLAQREAINGFPNLNIPEWAVKIVGKYRFREGFMKGHEMGFNTAWRGKVLTGFWKNADGSYDRDRPFYMAPSMSTSVFWNYSKRLKIGEKPVTWKIQLNIDNVFNEDLVLERDFYNVSPEEGAAVVAYGLKYNRGRQFRLTNTISF